jgi:hypothetical protein
MTSSISFGSNPDPVDEGANCVRVKIDWMDDGQGAAGLAFADEGADGIDDHGGADRGAPFCSRCLALWLWSSGGVVRRRRPP